MDYSPTYKRILCLENVPGDYDTILSPILKAQKVWSKYRARGFGEKMRQPFAFERLAT